MIIKNYVLPKEKNEIEFFFAKRTKTKVFATYLLLHIWILLNQKFAKLVKNHLLFERDLTKTF